MVEVCHALNEYAPNAIWAIEAEGDGLVGSLRWLCDNGLLLRACESVGTGTPKETAFDGMSH
jgi:hypothetical protein